MTEEYCSVPSLSLVPIGELDTDGNGLDLGNAFQLEPILATVNDGSTFLQRSALISAMLYKYFRESSVDRRLQRFLQFSFATVSGKTGKLASAPVPWHQLGISERQLRRLSHLYLGLSPKQFIKVLRFQHCLKIWQSSPNSVEPMYGYYDQPHFIREFKAMAGVTPGQFRKMSVLYNKHERS